MDKLVALANSLGGDDEDTIMTVVDEIERLRHYHKLSIDRCHELDAEIDRLRQFEQAWKVQGVEIAKLVNELRDVRADRDMWKDRFNRAKRALERR